MGGSSGPVKVGSPDDMKMINSGDVDAYKKLLGGEMSTAKGGMNSNQQNATNILQQIMNNSNNYTNLIKQMNSGPQGIEAQLQGIREAKDSYNPEAGLNAYIARNPELQGLAQSMAAGAFGPSKESGQALARRVSSDALSGTASELAKSGLLGSGAAMSTMTDAAIRPTLEMESNLAGRQADLYGNLMGNLGSQALGGLNEGYAMQGQNALNAAMNSAQLSQSNFMNQGQMFGMQDQALGNVAQGYGNMAGQNAGLYGQLMQSQAAMNEPVYWQPQYMAGAKGANWSGAGAGALTGAAAGATVGSLVPGIGTAVGAGGGFLIGGLAGLLS